MEAAPLPAAGSSYTASKWQRSSQGPASILKGTSSFEQVALDYPERPPPLCRRRGRLGQDRSKCGLDQIRQRPLIVHRLAQLRSPEQVQQLDHVDAPAVNIDGPTCV